MEQLQAVVLALIHQFGYAGLFVVMVLGNLGLPVGTELVVPAAGAAAGAGQLSSWLLVGVVATLGEIAGGLILYTIGYYFGEPVVRRFGRRAEHELGRVHAFYERYGTKTVLICRFIPMIRGIASLPPGVSRMQKRWFVTYHSLGSAIFCFGLAYLGNAAGQHLDRFMPAIHKFTILIGLAVLAAIVAFLWRRRSSASDAAP